MSDAFYNSLKATASNLLGNFGAVATFTRSIQSNYDPTTGQTLTSTEVFTAKAAGFGYKVEEVNESSILSTDIKLIVESDVYVPEVDDTLVWNGITYIIVFVSPVQPANQAVIYECQIRVGEKNWQESVVKLISLPQRHTKRLMAAFARRF
jgi:hypothetical protein